MRSTVASPVRTPKPETVRAWRAATAAAIAALLACCGIKGPPRPPELVHPKPPDHLVARASAEGIRLVWRRPTTYVDGTRMHDLRAFVVERAPAGPKGAPFARIATVVVTDPVRFRADRRVEFLDRTARAGERYLYRVIAVTADGYESEPAGPVGATQPPKGSKARSHRRN